MGLPVNIFAIIAKKTDITKFYAEK